MRDVEGSDKNVLTLEDKVAGSEIQIYYRDPTTEERMEYMRRVIERKGKKIIDKSFETRLDLGTRIMTGFRTGDFGMGGKPISSDPDSPEYFAEWKAQIGKIAADVIIALAFTVFESVNAGNTDVEFADSEDVLPLAKS